MNLNISLLGLQWGDEGKGKVVDNLANDLDAAVRYQGGHNADDHLDHVREPRKYHPFRDSRACVGSTPSEVDNYAPFLAAILLLLDDDRHLRV